MNLEKALNEYIEAAEETGETFSEVRESIKHLDIGMTPERRQAHNRLNRFVNQSLRLKSDIKNNGLLEDKRYFEIYEILLRHITNLEKEDTSEALIMFHESIKPTLISQMSEFLEKSNKNINILKTLQNQFCRKIRKSPSLS